MSEVIVRAKQLTKRFGEFTAVDDIDFSVSRGEIFGFLGPNGSGKTTTIRMLLGLLKPTCGSIDVLGVPVVEDPLRIRPDIGYMSQRFSLYADLTVMENLLFNGRVYGLRGKQLQRRVNEALELAGLVGRGHVLTRDLAGGWRQRLALGVAILHAPQLLFLDEPTAGVDPISRREFWELLYELSDQGTTIFVTTHYMDEAERCHRLTFIRAGRLIAEGSPQAIKHNILPDRVLEFTCLDPRAVEILKAARNQAEINIQEAALYGDAIHVVGPQVWAQRKAILRLLQAADLQIGPMALIEPSLEDVFIASMNMSDHEPIQPEQDRK